ncbi:MAG TPA: 16S rRNA (adenine(1518)-N(6)/adenine(1519)-N(6))-dimethyltransferase RsmA [Clostridiaceae bacterium]
MSKTLDIVKKYNFRFTKSLGQNFLRDDTVLDSILEGANISPEDNVLEIGPGFGTLTKELLKISKKVMAVEIDKKLIPILKDELKEFENFYLFNEDILKCDLNSILGEDEVKVVANLPYYITTPVLAKLLSGHYNISSIIVMVQKEVGERINAKVGTKNYGGLSLMIQYYSETNIIRHVPPTAFIPSPKVDSIILKLDLLKEPRVKVNNEEDFFRLIKESFNMRRKTLWNSLKSLEYSKEHMERVFMESNIDPNRRGETLTIEEFASISNLIF